MLLVVVWWSVVIFAIVIMGSVVLFICISNCVLFPAVSCVKSGHVVLSALGMRLSVCVHAYISYRFTFVMLW